MFSKDFLDKVTESIRLIDLAEVEKMVDILYKLRERKGRLFIIGSGGGAGHASHAACDFIKLCSMQAFSLDNISLLTALVNDVTYANTITHWLASFDFSGNDCIMVISVGGGTTNVSQNIYNAVSKAKVTGSKIIGILGPVGGETGKLADAKILITAKDQVTPVTEGIQSVILHLLCSHKKLQTHKPVWI